MSEENRKQLLDTLAALMKDAGLNAQERRVVSRKAGGGFGHRYGGKVRRRHGPYAHCKEGEQVKLTYPDGNEQYLRVLHCGPMGIRLTTLPQGVIDKRRAQAAALKVAFGELRNGKFVAKTGVGRTAHSMMEVHRIAQEKARNEANPGS